MQVDLQKSEVWAQLLMLRDAADSNLASCFREVLLYQGSLRAFADSYPPILSGISHYTATSSESRHLLGLFPPADPSHETTPLTCWYSSSGICSYNRRRFSKISNLLAVCIRTLSDWSRLQSLILRTSVVFLITIRSSDISPFVCDLLLSLERMLVWTVAKAGSRLHPPHLSFRALFRNVIPSCFQEYEINHAEILLQIE